MGQVGTLVEFTAQTTIVSDDVDQNFADLKAGINSAVFIDEEVRMEVDLFFDNLVGIKGRNAGDSSDIIMCRVNANDRVQISDALLGGAVVSEDAMATTATSGFFYISGGNGAPTGVPDDYAAGRYALYYDYANNRIYVYNGSWRSVAVA